MSIRIVTDSTCDIPEELAVEHGIVVVPVYVNIGESSYLEGVELSRAEFYSNLGRYPVYPTTAAPAAGAFADAYRLLANEGADEILSIHIASSLSATYNAARLGADVVNSVSVRLIDTRQITLGSGLLVMLAAEAAAAGCSAEEIVSLLNDRIMRTRVFGMIDNLGALRSSGRVNWAQFGFGSLLRVKPVMMIHQGNITIVSKIRTWNRALAEMIRMVSALGPFERLAVLHVNAPDAAETLKARAAALFPADSPVLVRNITPAIGTHLGLGAVGFACISKEC